MQRQRGVRVGIANQMRQVGDMHAGFGERGVVITVERREMLCVTLGGTVRAEELVLEIDGHFGHDGVAFFILRCRYLDSRQQVFLRIATQYAYRQLTTREDHGLAEVL